MSVLGLINLARHYKVRSYGCVMIFLMVISRLLIRRSKGCNDMCVCVFSNLIKTNTIAIFKIWIYSLAQLSVGNRKVKRI